MKRRIFDLLLFLGLLAITGAVVIVSGVFPVKASLGHLPGVAWLLEFASGRSIATYSMGIEVPPLDDPGLVRLGAVAYQSNCQWCHGGPSEPVPVVAAQMLPPPPYLPDVINKWKPEELFSIVKHGIKFAGMPAWPTQERDEEVWAVVAFLLQFPGLERSQYEALFEIEKTSPKSLSQADRDDGEETTHAAGGDVAAWQRCQLCHGPSDGAPVHALVPALAGQSADYLRNAMAAFASGERSSGIMQPIASRLTDEEVEQWVAYYSVSPLSNQGNGLSTSNLATSPNSSAGVENALAMANELVFHGDAQAKIPACVDCHSPTEEPQRSDYPVLTGQPSAYLERQLELFASGVRQGPRAGVMRGIAQKLSPQQRTAVAKFYQQSAQ